MSKTWYPVIDYEKCTECGSCTEKCSHGVYDLKKAPVPVVIYTQGCIENCHGCQDLCASGAIRYAGESLGNDSACSCNCSKDSGGCCS